MVVVGGGVCGGGGVLDRLGLVGLSSGARLEEGRVSGGVTGGGGVRLDGLSGGVEGTRVEAAEHCKHHHEQEDSAILMGLGHIDVSQASNSLIFCSGGFLVLFFLAV